jgi:hypothetical protein
MVSVWSVVLVPLNLLMSSRCRVDDQCLGITHIGQVRRQNAPLSKLHSSCLPSLHSLLSTWDQAWRGNLDSEGEHRPEATLPEVLFGSCVVQVRRQSWIRDPANPRVLLKPFSKGEGVLAVALHPKREGFEALPPRDSVLSPGRRMSPGAAGKS